MESIAEPDALEDALTDFKRRVRQFSQNNLYGTVRLEVRMSQGVIDTVQSGDDRTHKPRRSAPQRQQPTAKSRESGDLKIVSDIEPDSLGG